MSKHDLQPELLSVEEPQASDLVDGTLLSDPETHLPRCFRAFVKSISYDSESSPGIPTPQFSTESIYAEVPIKPQTHESSKESLDKPADFSDSSTNLANKSLVEIPRYRQTNLAENHIILQKTYAEVPDDVVRVATYIKMPRYPPKITSEQIRQDTDLWDLELGTVESAVESYFKANIFPCPKLSDGLKRVDKCSMDKHAVPDVGSKLKVSIPVPGMLYGYNSIEAFPEQQIQLRSMGNEMVANTEDLIYPFFVIEFTADGPGGSGSLWAATNKCLGASASCLLITDRLQRRLLACTDKAEPLDNFVFSIAMSGTEARVFISWKQNESDFRMQRIKSFILQDEIHYIMFREYVLNIIEWGKRTRLTQIRAALDSLLNDSTRKTSETAKSRPHPADELEAGTHEPRLLHRKTSDGRYIPV